MITLIQAETPDEIRDARTLFREYETWLGMSLCFQNFDDEVAALPGKYAMNEGGRLLLALADGETAGCVALRQIEEGVCEMKRLFVREGFRGLGIGRDLIEKLIEEARAEGYKKMRLDTFPPKMGKAVALYHSYDFLEIPPYYHNPYDGVLFMEKDL
jgi:ribosomal protein S18 acetylase RimI-like enzyme